MCLFQPAQRSTGYLTDVMHFKWLLSFALGGVLMIACGGQSSDLNAGSAGDASASPFGAQYQGDGVQCGALVCSGSQQCCLVYIAADAGTSNPTHACDQNCESVCADTCPDAGGQTSAGMPPAGGGGPPMGGTGAPGNMGGPMGGMGVPGNMGTPMGGTGAPGNMGGPMGGMGPGPANDGAPAAPGAPDDAGEQ
jgi:hypothetical protein